MELEHLNKTQIILLTLLVSFVTSIATGIVTVTLLDQAPPGVTYTISKVVEKTVERVVPAKNQGASVVKTVIIKEDDLISKAVEKNKRSLVEILIADKAGVKDKKNTGVGNSKKKILTKSKLVSTGFIASSDGLVITDSALVSGKGNYKVRIYNGDELNIKVLAQDEEKGIAILKIISDATSTEEKSAKIQTFPSVVFSDSDKVRLGQTVISLSGVDNKNTIVLTGIISSFSTGKYLEKVSSDNSDNNEVDIKEVEYRSSINTNLSITKKNSGSVSLNTDGGTVGMNLVHDGLSYTVPSNLIVNMIKLLSEKKSASTETVPSS